MKTRLIAISGKTEGSHSIKIASEMNKSDGDPVRKIKLSASETSHSDRLRKHASRSTKRVRKHRNTLQNKITVTAVL